MNVPKRYDIRFQEIKEKGAFALIISVQKWCAEEFLKTIRIIEPNVRKKIFPFSTPSKKFVITQGKFGYDNCGYTKKMNDGTLNIYFDIHQESVVAVYTTLRVTLHVLTDGYWINRTNAPTDVGDQLCDVQLSYGRGCFVIYGWMYPILRDTLCFVAKSNDAQIHISKRVIYNRFLHTIDDAMEEVWETLTFGNDQLSQLKNKARSAMSTDGKFMLTCFGDTVDLSTYMMGGPTDDTFDDTPVYFNSSGVGDCVQALTLIAGLAKMLSTAQTYQEQHM